MLLLVPIPVGALVGPIGAVLADGVIGAVHESDDTQGHVGLEARGDRPVPLRQLRLHATDVAREQQVAAALEDLHKRSIDDAVSVQGRVRST
jgi:hypothetical protein